ncbi:MAG: low temperature requirement protein A [Lachnospiraceae bacterium]|nr:low temperature requirement protein A [Lachnospiraceae bacterium]
METKREEKKVEYLELIYDLIFVYMTGRSNSLLEAAEGGFPSGEVLFAYLLGLMAVIQIWTFSTFYINLYGRNGVRDHIFLFANMILLYHMAEGTVLHRQGSPVRYYVAWTLILFNIALQHFLEMRHHRETPAEYRRILKKGLIVAAEAVLVLAGLLVYRLSGAAVTWVPILFGLVAVVIPDRDDRPLIPIDFAHLTERAMLYVVFTFGEMVLAIAPYFSGELTARSLYFSLMTFLIVVGLFLSYEVMYNRVIDRTRRTTGSAYMMIGSFLVFALNTVSAGLEFMREESIAVLPKTVFLAGALLAYYFFLFLSGLYAGRRPKDRVYILFLAAAFLAFFALMMILREQMVLNIALTALFVFGIFAALYRYGRNEDRD